MYAEAYDLIRDILEDEQLNAFIKKSTGKKLAIIDAGPPVTTPAAGILFVGGEIANPDNQMQKVRYNVPFALPYWDAKAMRRCHEFLDIAVEAFYAHKRGRNFVISVDPALMEDDPESQWWTVALRVTIAIF